MPTKGEWEQRGTRIADSSGDFVATVKDKETARRIVTAVNCHEDLVGLVEEYRECKQFDKAMGATVDFSRIDAVLAKAKGESV